MDHVVSFVAAEYVSLQFYGGDLTPYGPTSMLAAMWKASDELAGYAQQGEQHVLASSEHAAERDPSDAQSFFLAALNQIHAHTEDSIEGAGPCPCIAREWEAPSSQVCMLNRSTMQIKHSRAPSCRQSPARIATRPRAPRTPFSTSRSR